MNEVVDSAGIQYAVIAGLRTETGFERLVIAYPNEESLRDLIAAPSILALGFSSREEAVAGVMRTDTPRRPMAEASASAGPEGYRLRLNWAESRGKKDSTLHKLAGFFATYYCDLAATVTAVFFSTNAVSAVIRMALGSSV